MVFSRKLILLTVFFSCLGSFIFYTGLQPDDTSDDSIMVRKDFDVPGWRHKDLHNATAVLDALKANITIFADYAKNDYDPPVNLYIGYYNSLEKAKLSHAPQVCFTAQGWIIQKNDKIRLVIGNRTREVNRLVLEKEKERLLVYYWYQTANKTFADIYKMKLNLLYGKLTRGRKALAGNAFVRVSTSIVSDKERSELELQNFINELVKSINLLWVGKKRNNGGKNIESTPRGGGVVFTP